MNLLVNCYAVISISVISIKKSVPPSFLYIYILIYIYIIEYQLVISTKEGSFHFSCDYFIIEITEIEIISLSKTTCQSSEEREEFWL